MTIGEKLYFVRQLRGAFGSIGAIIPTSRHAARVMAAEVARRRGPKTILEVGPGTGAITAAIIKHLGPADRLVLCEINPGFVAYLRQRFEREPAFRRVRDQVTLHEMSVTALEGRALFDNIVSAIPFTACPPDLVEAIFERYRELLRPGGVLTYIEYAYLRALKRRLHPAARAEAEAVSTILERYIRGYEFRRDTVWRNVPPAWIRNLRFAGPQPADAWNLVPLEHTHRVALGDVPVASDALPLVAGLSGLGLLLGRRSWRRGLLPLLAAATSAWFLRDPYRQMTINPNVAYAASDGRVLAVERIRDARLGEEEWLRIAVFLSLADVHINRAPIAGKVVRVFREPGGYAAANRPRAEHNAAQYTVIEGSVGRCVVAQRAGMVARRIVNWSREGDLLAQGERFGLIRFGSRTDVYLPAAHVEACVAPGDRVRAGETIIARYTGDTAR